MSNKKLIQQYVSTGAILSEQQITKLSDNLRKTYLRRRINQYNGDMGWMSHSLRPYEIALLDDESLNKYISELSSANIKDLLSQVERKGGEIKDRVIDKITKYGANTALVYDINVINLIYDLVPNADQVYLNKLKNIDLSTNYDDSILRLLQRTKNVDLMSSAIDKLNPNVIEDIINMSPEYTSSALLHINDDAAGISRLLDKYNKIGYILLHDNNVIVASKKLGLDVVKKTLDRIYAKMVDKFGDDAISKLNNITTDNSVDKDGMKELLKLLYNE